MHQETSNDGLQERIGDRIRGLRKLQGLTLLDLSRLTNMDESTLSRIETGERPVRLEHIPILAGALAVTPEALTKDTAEFSAPPLRSAADEFYEDLKQREEIP